jgi:hypothetical protein
MAPCAAASSKSTPSSRWGRTVASNVGSGSKTEVPGFARHVRFTLRCRHRQPAPACPFGARKRHPDPCAASSRPLSVTRVLAVVRVGKGGRLALVTPDLFPSSLRMLQEIVIPIFEVSVDCSLRVIHRLITAVVDDRARHPAEDRLDHVQKLSAGRQRCGLDQWTALTSYHRVVSFDSCEKLFRDMSRRGVPREIKFPAIGVKIDQSVHHADHLARILLHAVEMGDLIA